MISFLHIENVAVIEKAEISFEPGFSVMTGETGAGKSIIIDALGAVLGGRTPRDIIRTGTASAIVSAIFYTGENRAVAGILEELGIIAEDEELLIQREMFADGRNLCRVNGRPVTVSQLRSLGSVLVNIHGQNDGQRLLNESYHLSYLDMFINDPAPLEEYRSAFGELKKIENRLKSLSMDEAEKAARIENLKYRINELEAASLNEGEEEALEEQRNLLKNAAGITEALETAYYIMGGDEDSPGIVSNVGVALKSISAISGLSDEYNRLYTELEQLSYSAEDILERLRDARRGFEFSAEDLERVESRLDVIYRLKRKYRKTFQELISLLSESRNELEEIEFSDQELAKLEARYKEAYEKTLDLAEKLSIIRGEGAKQLEERILSELRQLDMGKVRFSVQVSKRKGADMAIFTDDGINEVSFLISTNTGEPLKPIARIASGGELARIMLALKNVLAENDYVDTLIFDEVDTGVSGRAAQRVAEKLFDVSLHKQVICVSHLPQIAAMADVQYSIEKSDSSGKTLTHITRLSPEGRKKEISRLTAGEQITQAALVSAEEMLQGAENYKKAHRAALKQK